jgi:fructokinase
MSSVPLLGGIEAGGTKWVCAVGTGPDDLRSTTFPTGDPTATIREAIQFFRSIGRLDAMGIGSFGPLDLHTSSPTWGSITTTPKPGWRDVNVVRAIREALAIPVVLDTDVNAAALAEARWGAASGLDTFCYLTAGTGIGGGGMIAGELMHGLIHPEFGHMRIPHDRSNDPFAGVCPFHGDCLEGLASGEAARLRWGLSGPEPWPPEAIDLEARYLALGLINVVSVVSPQRLILGGGVMKQPGLLQGVRAHLRHLAGGYFDSAFLREDIDAYVVEPALGDRAGVLGAIELAREQPPNHAG